MDRPFLREVAGILIAAGLDPKKTAIFIQSHISAHAELAWILNCLTPVGWMQRMTQFKEKSQKQRQQVSVGLFDYPALMASDILLYETDLVPVGEDQKQHLEFTREIAQRFNTMFGNAFKLPEPSIYSVGARIMGLDDPTKKMSKSEDSRVHAIHLLDSPDDIRTGVMRATTDSLREIRFDENRPGIYNLLILYELFSEVQRDEIEARFEGKGCADLKKELAEIVIEKLRPLQSKYHDLTNDANYIDAVLSDGALTVRPIAEKTLATVKTLMGLG